MVFLVKRTDNEHTRITCDYQQNGPHLVAKRLPGKNMFKLFKGYSKEFGRVESSLSDFIDGRILTNRTDFLPEWEQTVGIPDDEFQAIGTESERQNQALCKLSAEGVSSDEDLVWLCSILGFSVTVYPGHFFWLNPDPRVILSSEKESRFTIVFEVDFSQSDPEVEPNFFPVPFPWVFGANSYKAMREYFDTVIPSNVNAQWIDVQIGFQNVWKDTNGDPEVTKDLQGDPNVTKDKLGGI